MDDHQVLHDLTEIFREVFQRDDLILQPNWTASDIEGWDSFKHIEIIITVEERFGVKMTTRELDNLKSVGDLLTLIQAKTAGSA